MKVCARFVVDHAEEIGKAQPEIPEDLNDRAVMPGRHHAQGGVVDGLDLSVTSEHAGEKNEMCATDPCYGLNCQARRVV